MIRFVVNAVAMGIILGVLGFALIQEVSAEGLVSNDCYGWAVATGKEGRVRDSISMHLLGCDDGPQASAHYRAEPIFEGCGTKARAITRSNPWYYMVRPWTVAKLVKQAMPWCTVYEDGSYEDNSTH